MELINRLFLNKVFIDKTETVGETKIANKFNNFLTNIGSKIGTKNITNIKTFGNLYE